MNPHLRYLRTVLKHKFFVLVAGLRVGVPLWQLIIHDWSKFTPKEWGPYVNRFGRGRSGAMNHEKDSEEWYYAFLHHIHHSPHHWEHWVLFGEPRAMPEKYVLEMVADWMGAGRAYTGHWEVVEWYAKNQHRIKLHDTTRRQVEALVSKYGCG